MLKYFTNLMLMVLGLGLVLQSLVASGTIVGDILKHEGCAKLSEVRSYVIECNFTDNFTVDANSLPSGVEELIILQGGDIRFDRRSFSKIDPLRRVVVSNVRSLTMATESFSNLSSKNLWLKFNNIQLVEIESQAIHLSQGPITLLISECTSVKIELDTIPWIQELTINGVTRLQLTSISSSSQRIQPWEKYIYTTNKIHLMNVSTNELPANFFPPSTREIKISSCKINTLRKNFVSLSFGGNITITKTVIDVIESEAFKNGSYFEGLILLEKVNVKEIQSRAILSWSTYFSVIDSSIQIIHDQAFSVKGANMLFENNEFADIRTNGIVIDLASNRNAKFTNNTLQKLSNHSIKVQNTKELSEFIFKNNVFYMLEAHSLLFNLSQNIPFDVSENIFLHCACDLPEVCRTYADSKGSLTNAMYNESFCCPSPDRSECLQHPEGRTRISEYLLRSCNADEPECFIKSEVIPANASPDNATEIKNLLNLIEENPVTFGALFVACAGILFLIVLTACLWVNRSKHPSRECHFSSICQHFRCYLTRFIPSNSIVRSRSSSSISRVPVHDYAEVLPPKFVYSDEDTYICTDKATQTLPEELTQELLQTLRDKLDDPENYREARCMIEHLYDLIKVEECCNHNQLDEDVLDLSPDEGVDISTDTTENLYDTIGLDVLHQRRYRKSRSSRKGVDRGTRAPSPDKLMPQSYTNTSYTSSMRSRRSAPTLTLPRPSVTDYIQPVDHLSLGSSQLLYDYASISSTLDIADRRSTNSTASTRGLTTAYSIGPYVLTEYKDPCDVKVPIYSQLEEMIQRPLPLTPLAEQVNNDLGDLRGTRL